MARSVISPEEGEELTRLYADLASASAEANKILRKSGMHSPVFFDADKKVSIIIRRIKEILGVARQHWMAI